jgi:hypothetical protein
MHIPQPNHVLCVLFLLSALHSTHKLLHILTAHLPSLQRVLGPFPSGNTATYLGIFRLMRIMSKVKHWAAATYWPYLKGLVEARGRVSAVAGVVESFAVG